MRAISALAGRRGSSRASKQGGDDPPLGGAGVRSCPSVFAAQTSTALPAAPPVDSGRVWAVVAGGGTIGHLAPGLAAAEELVRRGCPQSAVWFVGSVRGVEATRLPAAGWPHTLLPGRGIQRKLTLDNVAAVCGLLKAFAQSVRLLRRLRPAVVLATGGYASVACAVAAALWRIPLVVAEQNAVPGLANRFSSRWAKACAVSFPGTDLPRATLTGNPVRPDMAALDPTAERAAARAALGVAEGCTFVVVFGGSLGARRLNEAAMALRQRWADRDDLVLRHIVGDRDWARYQTAESGETADGGQTAGLRYQPIRFEDRMAEVLAAADVVLCRAGASTAAELTVVGVPAVLVPLPNAPGDHQTANAAVLAHAGGAVLVPDADATPDRLAHELEAIIASATRRREMAAALRSLGRPNAAGAVADLVVTHAARPLPAAEEPR